MKRMNQPMFTRIAGTPGTPARIRNLGTALALSKREGPGTALALSKREGPGTALALSKREGPGTALALSMREGPGTALALSMRAGPGTALALSANAGDAAQTNAIVPKMSVLYEVIKAPISLAKRASAKRTFATMLPFCQLIESSHRAQHFSGFKGKNCP